MENDSLSENIQSNENEIDLTKSDIQSSELDNDYIPERNIEERDYDPRPQEDTARRRIAYSLIFLLGLVIVSSMFYLFCSPCGSDKNALDGLVAILQIILSPLIALVSAATGFYYGAKKN